MKCPVFGKLSLKWNIEAETSLLQLGRWRWSSGEGLGTGQTLESHCMYVIVESLGMKGLANVLSEGGKKKVHGRNLRECQLQMRRNSAQCRR